MQLNSKLAMFVMGSALIGSLGALRSVSAQVPTLASSCHEQQSTAATFALRCTVVGPSIKQFRAIATCTGGRTVYGGWTFINSGQWSRADCGPNRLAAGNAEFR
jgi:hypothetical protein